MDEEYEILAGSAELDMNLSLDGNMMDEA